MDAHLQRAWTSCVRDARYCAALMLDIDWFERYNDPYGHQAGDDCLRRVASSSGRTTCWHAMVERNLSAGSVAPSAARSASYRFPA
ncbi:diguanylate cyclase [Janthinobacterium sp. GB4P2]|uniref:diguanylate cyclase n=1 Tax=Janthinobacterium sp. GB4P2 TaxID=3424189 RepID=UPI003F21BE2C